MTHFAAVLDLLHVRSRTIVGVRARVTAPTSILRPQAASQVPIARESRSSGEDSGQNGERVATHRESAVQSACGCTTVRMSRVRGRRDDMLIIRGVNLCPSEVERIVLGVPDLAPRYQLIVERPGALDELILVCEPARDGVDREQLRARLSHGLHPQAGITVAIGIVDRDQVPRSEGKAVRMVDLRPR